LCEIPLSENVLITQHDLDKHREWLPSFNLIWKPVLNGFWIRLFWLFLEFKNWLVNWEIRSDERVSQA
jgi:hypothetical protein